MTALLFLQRYWKLIVGGVLLLALGVQTVRLSASQRSNEVLRAELATERARIELQNEMVEALRQRGEEAQGRAREALETARRQSAASQGAIDALRRSSQRVRGSDEPCTISDELRGMTGL
jgi:hypothetical protein